MLLYCTMISFGFVCHRQGVSPFSKQGWGCLENIPNTSTYIIFTRIFDFDRHRIAYIPYPYEYILFYKISLTLVNISCWHNIFRTPLHNDSFCVFWNDIIFYEHFIHRNIIMPNLCLISSHSNSDILCVELWFGICVLNMEEESTKEEGVIIIYILSYILCYILSMCIYIF